MRSLILCVAVSLMTACGNSESPAAPASDPTMLEANAVVERVVDGDTVVVSIDGTSEHMRLIGIDTPETVKPNSPVECFGPEASAFTKSLLPEGTAVRVVRDVEARDDYDRLLGYLYRADDGLFVNLEIIRRGYASLLTFPPNIAHVDEFRAAAEAARRADLGLWVSCAG
jgi:micrococcal nuclease